MKFRSQGIKKLFPVFFLVVLTFTVFRAWFTVGAITSGDFPFYFRENLNGLFSFPHLWDGQHIALLFLYPPIFLTGLLSKLGLGFALVERFVWFWPFLILTIFSSWYLVKTLLPKNVFWFFCPFVFLFNTYILMVVGGGQVGIAMAYALAPLVFGLFIKSIQTPSIKSQIIAGLVLAFQVVFDPRISLITVGAVFLYAIFQYGVAIKKYIKTFVLPLFIVLGLHFYWLLPAILVRRTALPGGYGEPGWVEFLSFARFSDSVSLLHPNWPENIFGKTYFFRPEFLILPILAFSSLLFINYSITNYELRIKKNVLFRQKQTCLFFALLAIIGAFLAKGVNPPFGEVYLWLFNNIPGMNLFRDPTKFYLLTALSYSLLIPFSLTQICRRLKKISNIKYLISSIFILYWLFLIRPAWLGQLSGTFKAKAVPQEYVILKDFIHNQEGFFRTFWVPKRQRFGFFSNNHPAISAENFLTDTVCLEPFCSLKTEMAENWGEECFPNDRCYVRELSYFLNPKTVDVLAKMAVKYVIVPFDSEGEIFIAEHQYNHQQREEVEEFLDTISWLKKIKVTDKIAVYEIPSYKDHFFGIGEEIPEIQWQMINPTKYLVQVKNARQPFNLVFSETYDELWQARLDSRSARLAKIGGKIIPSTRYNNLNSFPVDQAGDFEIVVEFTAQKYVYWGLIVSAFTLLMSTGVLVYLRLFLVKQCFVCS